MMMIMMTMMMMRMMTMMMMMAVTTILMILMMMVVVTTIIIDDDYIGDDDDTDDSIDIKGCYELTHWKLVTVTINLDEVLTIGADEVINRASPFRAIEIVLQCLQI
jgi:hypothetical protein